MGARARYAVIALVAILLAPATAQAADLVIISNQGATPGVRELAVAFSRTSGHKVTVVQETGAALERRINSGPADLITNRHRYTLRAGRSWRLGARRRREARHQYDRGL